MDMVDSMWGAGSISIPCEINGQTFQKCKIDTGTPFTTVKKDLLKSTGTLVNNVNVTSFNGEIVECDVTIDNTIDFTGTSFQNSLLILCPQLKSTGVDVIVGLDILAQKSFSIDFNEGTLKIDAAENFESSFAFTKDLSDHYILPVSMGSASTQAMFDTGASMTLVDIAFVEQHPEKFTLIADNSVTDTHGNVVVTQLVIGNSLTIGNTTFVAEYYMAVDLSSAKKSMGIDADFIIGYNIIKSANWAFSPQQNLWKNW